ncbi:MAG: hypothetical protein ING59_15415 [Burkholderiales bacterium]|jgi:hypothetical protein|nr:hypothetical protein [Burkholderiales bacterium]
MPIDLAQVRLDNALLLFEEFVQQAARQPDAATLRGLEGRFAERLQIQPSYWSQIKSRSRQIGERLARQFEERMRKPYGWMDTPHPQGGASAPAPLAPAPLSSTERADEAELAAQTDDERFIVGLVLTYYRRHPDKARARLLDLLSEVLVAAPALSASPPPAAQPARGDRASEAELLRRSQAGVQPLKRRR